MASARTALHLRADGRADRAVRRAHRHRRRRLAAVPGRADRRWLLAFLTFLSRLYSPVRGLGSTVTAAYSAAAGAERVIELLNEPTTAGRPTRRRRARAPRGQVAFEGVGFQLSRPATDPRCDDVSFSIAPGEVVAVVGASGAGKIDARPTADAQLRPGVGQGDARRPRPARPDPVRACAATSAWCSRRRCSSTAHPRQHRVRPPRRQPGGDPGGRAWPRTPTGSSRSCPTGTTHTSANGDGGCPAARPSGSPSPGRCSATPRSSCSTSRPPCLDAGSADRVAEPLRPADGGPRDAGHLPQADHGAHASDITGAGRGAAGRAAARTPSCSRSMPARRAVRCPACAALSLP